MVLMHLSRLFIATMTAISHHCAGRKFAFSLPIRLIAAALVSRRVTSAFLLLSSMVCS